MNDNGISFSIDEKRSATRNRGQRTINIATWNVRSLYECDKLAQVIAEAKRLSLDWIGMSKSMPYWFTRLVSLLLRDRRFRVHMGNDTSSWRPQRNGLPQSSVLAPVLFNLYSNDLPVTRGRKFIYADDTCLAIQGQYFSELECSLSSDMAQISHFCRQWRLNQVPPKQSAVCSTCIIPAPPVPCISSQVPSVLHLSQGFQCSPTLNRQPYEGRLPLTSWWRKLSNMTVGQSSLISLAHHCYNWHPGSCCG